MLSKTTTVAKEHELRQAVKDYESQLVQATQSLAEFKHRALTAEVNPNQAHFYHLVVFKRSLDESGRVANQYFTYTRAGKGSEGKDGTCE